MATGTTGRAGSRYVKVKALVLTTIAKALQSTVSKKWLLARIRGQHRYQAIWVVCDQAEGVIKWSHRGHEACGLEVREGEGSGAHLLQG